MSRPIKTLILALVLVPVLMSPAIASLSLSLHGLHIERSRGGDFFLQLLEQQGCGIKWTSVSMEPDTFGMSGKLESPGRIYPGAPSVTLRVRSSNRLVSGVYRLKWNALMVSAARNIPRGKIITAEDLAVREGLYKRSLGEPFSSKADLVGKRTKKRMDAGDIISARNVEQKMMVERGDRLTILSRSGGVEAKLPGTALESGTRGSTIRVRIKEYRKDIHAMVLGPGMVLVSEGI